MKLSYEYTPMKAYKRFLLGHNIELAIALIVVLIAISILGN